MTGTTTIIQRPRRSAAVRATERIQYNKRAIAQRAATKVEKRQQKEAAAAAKEERQKKKDKVAQKRQREEEEEEEDPTEMTTQSPSKKVRSTVKKVTKKVKAANANSNEQRQPDQVQKQQQAHPLSHLYDLSVEVWELIFQDFCPSELSTLAQVSNHFKSIVTFMPLWKTVCAKATLPNPTKRGRCKTYYQVVLKHSQRVCEKCYSFCAKTGSGAALPVHLDDQNKEVNLCLACRKAHFIKYPEPAPPDSSDEEASSEDELPQYQRHHRRRRITKGTSMASFKLNDFDMENIYYTPVRNPYYRSAAPMRLFDRNEVHMYARQVHGGDVGIEAARSKSRNMVATRRHNLQIRREREKQERDAREKALDEAFDKEKVDKKLVSNMIHQYIGSKTGTIENCIAMARERNQRRDTLKKAIEAAGYPFDDRSNTTEFYIYQLDTNLTLQEAVRRLAQEAILKKEREDRRSKLQKALEKQNIKYNDSSSFCQNYIANGTPDFEHVIQTLVERKWFVEHTIYGIMGRDRYYNYSSDWYFDRENFMDRSPHSKFTALKEFIKARLSSDKYYQSIKEDQASPSRPPESLWPQMDTMMAQAWKEVASDYVSTAFFAQDQLLVSALAIDSDNLSTLVSNDQIVQLLDEGMHIKMSTLQQEQQHEDASLTKKQKKKKKQQQRPPTPPSLPISFSGAMRQSIGDQEFESFYGTALVALANKIKDAYIMRAITQVPEQMKTFIEGCKVTPGLTRPMFNDQRAQFIQDKLPTLSQETNIHLSYLTSLVNLMDPWRYPYINYRNQHRRLT